MAKEGIFISPDMMKCISSHDGVNTPESLMGNILFYDFIYKFIFFKKIKNNLHIKNNILKTGPCIVLMTSHG